MRKKQTIVRLQLKGAQKAFIDIKGYIEQMVKRESVGSFAPSGKM